jgi:hypothetical protein
LGVVVYIWEHEKNFPYAVVLNLAEHLQGMRLNVLAIAKPLEHVALKVAVALMFLAKRHARHLVEPIEVFSFAMLILVPRLVAWTTPSVSMSQRQHVMNWAEYILGKTKIAPSYHVKQQVHVV